MFDMEFFQCDVEGQFLQQGVVFDVEYGDVVVFVFGQEYIVVIVLVFGIELVFGVDFVEGFVEVCNFF